MIKIEAPNQCCGCTACFSVCNHKAIEMQPDAMGFLYPVVNQERCVDCGLCEKICSFNKNYDISLNLKQSEAYGARHKDMEEIETSRSGAAFIAISDWIIEQGGVVYGVGYSDHFRVVHKRATTKEERNEFKGSKYVQSDLTGIFPMVKQDLNNGLIVLFSGTPCQIAGLKSYIGRKLSDNLYLMDIVCHGIPGPFLWRDYIKYIEEKQGDEIVLVNFRDKQQFGWSKHHETFIFKTKNEKLWFDKTFYKPTTFRYSCGNCHYCNTKRPSDITIGDFWGWQKTNPEINRDDKGVSLVLVNTEKGRELFESAKKDLTVFSANLEDCLQPNLKAPTPMHKKRKQFEQEYMTHGFKYVFEKDYDRQNVIRRFAGLCKRKLIYVIRKF